MSPIVSGTAAEKTIISALNLIQDTYVVRPNWPIPPRSGCRSSRIEWMLFPNMGGKVGIEIQTQNRPGSAEQRITDKIKTLSNITKQSNGEFAKFYILLIGNGFRERERFMSPAFKKSIGVGNEVEVITFDHFFTRASSGTL